MRLRSYPLLARAVKAFPGAEGFGQNAVGGRGGAVIEVTNLNDRGPGSLRNCIGASGPRTCVFRVGGTIVVDSDIKIDNPYLTITGQIPATIVLTDKRVDGLDDKTMEECVVERLKTVVEMGEKAGVTILLDPLNDKYNHPNHWLTSSDKGAEICRRIGSSRLRMLFDTYHMRILEGDLLKHIERNIDAIGHFHAAGVPGRHEVFNSDQLSLCPETDRTPGLPGYLPVGVFTIHLR